MFTWPLEKGIKPVFSLAVGNPHTHTQKKNLLDEESEILSSREPA